ncbi:MAG: prolipoprotein diacylglyceryl transferase [Candidatus Omnitrophica bacterium]|nr:prolipoprotein diacylglyceryl transferase [Candidatus Omnitrophota bacterium]MCK5289185.1 prolipoprotein diacylglyceryl transferase [Candidatus Omnitrophota bacterium]MCK5492331.1 prolipoprotein diacylglyceryl transferase [Candidatus Omnitrophota bacterium]
MHPILCKIGPLTLYTYGLFVFLGVSLSYFICSREAKKQKIDSDIFSNIFFWLLIMGFLGARIIYIFVEWKGFLNDPFSLIFNNSGFVFYGGVIFGIGTLWYLSRRYKIAILKLADILALGVPLAHSLGRVGCFFYGCCYGMASNSFFGVLFPPDSPAGYLGVKVIPIQLISSFFLFIIFCFLMFIKRKKKFQGQLAILYIFLYSVFRFCVEFFRGDSRGNVYYLSTSQFISVIMIFLSIYLFKQLKHRI